jgi:hypothetical protein
VGISFQKDATQILQSMSNAPRAVNMLAAAQAGKMAVAVETVFWGLSASGGLCCEEYQGHTAVPRSEGGLCGLLKRDPHGPTIRS